MNILSEMRFSLLFIRDRLMYMLIDKKPKINYVFMAIVESS
jgi:hypothetical protein